MSDSQILHIAQDEKFISAAQYLFEKAFPRQNRFIIIKAAADPPLRYIDDQLDAEFIVRSQSTVSDLLAFSKKAKVVVFHGLNPLKGDMFLKSPEKQKFVGIIYGGEVYNSRISGDDFLGDKTRELDEKLKETSIIDRIKDFLRWIKYYDMHHLYEDVKMEDVFYRMNSFGFTSKSTYEGYIKRGIINPTSQMIPFSYYPLEYIIKDDTLRATGPNILLGNSASATNNHLEAIDFLKKLEIKERQVVTPLSYGFDNYANVIESYGYQQLSDNFVSVREFMPLEQYNKLISNCGFVVMNHYRSQAMGNLITSIYLGAKVFLNETDAYKHFRDIGCYVYSISEDLVKNGKASLTPLTEDQVAHNRQILRDELSTQVLVNKLQQSFKDFFMIKA